jgi:hypothetical protein
MTTALQKAAKGTNRKSSTKEKLLPEVVAPQSDKEKLLPEVVAPQSENMNEVKKKGKTPPKKQAKRDFESKKNWLAKNKINRRKLGDQTKETTRAREGRDKEKNKNKELANTIKSLSSALKKIQEAAAQQNSEHLEHLAHIARLESIIKGMQETFREGEVIAGMQNAVTDKMESLNSSIGEFNAEHMENPELEDEVKKKIAEVTLDCDILDSKLDVQLEVHKSRVESISEISNNIIFGKGLDLLSSEQMGLASALIGRQLNELSIENFQLRSKLGSLADRFTRKKSRKGILESEERANGYSYPLAVIMLCIRMFHCAISMRGIESVLKVFSELFDVPTPSRTVINDWCKKIGLYLYLQEKPKAVKPLWIVDFTVIFGGKKLMLILQTDLAESVDSKLSKIKLSEEMMKMNCDDMKRALNLQLKFSDVQVIHMKVMESTAYRFTLDELNKAVEKHGVPSMIVSDEGSDLAKAIRLFIEIHKVPIHLHDISHKINNIIKAHIKDEELFRRFTRFITEAKQSLKISSVAFLSPPKVKEKMRFSNAGSSIGWAIRALKIDRRTLTEKQKEQFGKAVTEPLSEFKERTLIWNQIMTFARDVEKEIKRNGLTRGNGAQILSTSAILSAKLEERKISDEAKMVSNQILEFVKTQEIKLSPGETAIASSDIIESMFGRLKAMSLEDSMAGITDKILILPLLTAKLTPKLTKDALENCSYEVLNQWCYGELGETAYAQRNRVLNPQKKPNNKRGQR